MPNQKITIVGAGLSGLIAAHAWPTAQVLEASRAPRNAQQALLRFRTDVVSKLTGIEFRKVQVRKGIFYGGKFVEPNILLANLYAQKVIGRVVDRSIWNLQTVERFVAPETLYEELIEAVGDRITWGKPFTPGEHSGPIISTAPLPAVLKDWPINQWPKLKRAGIRVRRWRMPESDVYQTVYFPDPETPIYRASITGSLLIVEEVAAKPEEESPLAWVEDAFGINAEVLEPLGQSEQSYGKVDELPALERKRVLYELTTKYGIYSLGRFATWRNVLLDDVVNDIVVIKRLLKSQTHYEVRKVAS
jgi:hypothetical protein